MAKVSNREKILSEGLRVVHEHGFANASVRDIVQAAGVPQGSFTNHFASKEAFGLEVIDLYFSNASQMMVNTLRNDALPPLERLRAYLDGGATCVSSSEKKMRNGCLLGNFTVEANEDSELIRKRLVEVFAEVQSSIAYCLNAAIKTGDIPKSTHVEDLAGFILSGIQGANLLAKAERSPAPIERFKEILFTKILK